MQKYFPVFLLLLVLPLTGIGDAVPASLLPNMEFHSANGKTPDGWVVSQPRPAEDIFRLVSTADGNILEISEKSAAPVNYTGARFSAGEIPSLKVQLDVKLEDISKNAAVIYYWLDDKGKFIGDAKYVFLGKGNSDWRHIEKIVAPDNPVQTRGVMFCLSVYGNPDGGGKASFRRLKVTAADGQEKTVTESPPVVQKAFKRYSFRDNFTAKPEGVPYYLNRNGVGFLDFSALNTGNPEVNMTVTVPRGVNISLYLFYPRERQCVRIPASAQNALDSGQQSVFQVSRDYDWGVWGNGLFIEAGSQADQAFNIDIEFKTGAESFKSVIPVELLPPPGDINLPRGFKCHSFYSFPLNRIGLSAEKPDPLPEKLYRKWTAAGFVGGWGLIPGGRDWEPFWELHGVFPWRVADAAPQDRNILLPAKTFSGADGTLVCPSILIEKGPAVFAECLRRYNQLDKLQVPGAYCQIDYEPYVDGWTTAMCFCPRCLEHFTAFAKLDKQQISRQKILPRYEKEWIRFRCVQNSRVIKVMADAVRQINPTARFMLCSMPQAAAGEEEDYLKRYGIDLRLYESFTDIHTPMIYNTDLMFYRRLQSCFENLKKPIRPTLSSGWGAVAPYNPQRYRLHLMAAAMLGADGAVIYSGVFQMDDAYFNSQREVMNLIHAIEDEYLIKGKVDGETIAAVPQFQAAGNLYSLSRTFDGKYLVLLCNNSEEDQIFASIRAKSLNGNYRVRDLKSKTTFTVGDGQSDFTAAALQAGISIKIAPFDYALVEISPARSAPAAYSATVNADQVAAQEKAWQASFDAKLNLREENGVKTGTVSIDGKLFYLVETGMNKVLINLKDSAVAEWLVKQGQRTAVRQVGIDILTAPTPYWAKNLEAAFKNYRTGEQAAEACFTYTISQPPFDGLKVEKTYTVSKEKPELSVKVVILPEKGYRQFTYRANNILGIADNAEDISYRIPADSGIAEKKYEGKKSGNLILPKTARVENWCAAVNMKTGEQVKVSFNGQVDELMFWRQGDIATAELIYDKAYRDNDPHKAAPWTAEYRLEYIAGSKNAETRVNIQP
jgi:hypothetical protein